MMKSLLLASLVLLLTSALVGCRSDATPAPEPGTQGPTAVPAAVVTPSPAPRSTSAAVVAPTPTSKPTPRIATAPPVSSPQPASEASPPPSPTSPGRAETVRTAPTPTVPAPVPTVNHTPTASPEPTPEVIRVSRSSMQRDEAPGATEADLTALVAGNNAFAFDLYHALSESHDNLVFSPHSISLALAMAFAGARGETERQMTDTLRFELPQDRLHPAFNTLDLLLDPGTKDADSEAFRLNVANSVWGQQDFGFLPDYLDALAVNYGEEVRPVDFRRDPESARVGINDWVADETEDRITNLIPPDVITELTRLVLANAIYFKAAWHSAFDERATRDRTFHLLDGTDREVPMMRQQSNLRYATSDGYQAVELPYEGGEVAMTILVPDSGRFGEFQDSLSGQSVPDIVGNLDYELVNLTMPKFEMDSAFSLSDTLEAMGMPDAFDDEASNFSGMDGRFCRARGDICLLISDVLHKAFVSADEEGTEAAAATAVIIGITRAVPVEPDPIELVVDRPFLFVIRHLASGAILFVGRVLQP